MPWTPMAVSAWRTSSSLNGLMIATTSFMGGGLHHVLGSFTARRGLPMQIWHLSVQMAQKSCRRKWNHFRWMACISVQAAGSSATIRLSGSDFLPGSIWSQRAGSQVGGAYAQLVLCRQRPAAGTLWGCPAPRSHLKRHRQVRHPGVDRGHGRLAESHGSSGIDARRRAAADDADGRTAADDGRWYGGH